VASSAWEARTTAFLSTVALPATFFVFVILVVLVAINYFWGIGFGIYLVCQIQRAPLIAMRNSSVGTAYMF
jgi:hypothetical protein